MQRHEKESSDDGTDVLGGFVRKCLVFLLVLYVLHLCLKCVAKIQPFFDCYKEITIANGSVLRGTNFLRTFSFGKVSNEKTDSLFQR